MIGAGRHLHHELMQALLAGVAGLLPDCLQLALVLSYQPLHLRLQALAITHALFSRCRKCWPGSLAIKASLSWQCAPLASHESSMR